MAHNMEPIYHPLLFKIVFLYYVIIGFFIVYERNIIICSLFASNQYVVFYMKTNYSIRNTDDLYIFSQYYLIFLLR